MGGVSAAPKRRMIWITCAWACAAVSAVIIPFSRAASSADTFLNTVSLAGTVAAASRKMIVIADESKLVPRLGKFPLPVEVVEFGHKSTATRLSAALTEAGYTRPSLTLRQRDGAVFKTDGGNVIYDIAFGSIQNAPKLGSVISAVPGVVEHGLFIGLATTLLIAGPGEIEVINR